MPLAEAQQLDLDDPLAYKRSAFDLPDGTIYLDGNSLGALPRHVHRRMQTVVEQQWGQDLIESWNRHHWITLPVSVGEKIAPLIGAGAGQVVCCDSISVNLLKILAAAFQWQSMRDPKRRVIVSQRDNFPTDLYVGQGMAQWLGAERCQFKSVAECELESALDESVAILMLTHVNFRTGAMHDMARLTRLAHERGVLVVWDLAHSAGALPVDLDECQVDFAVGCGYKYLNGGPGAPAFVYVATRHQRYLRQPLSGWMGHREPFAFASAYEPAEGVLRFLCGTPNILSLSALDAALDVFGDVSMQAVRAKSLALSKRFMSAVEATPGLQVLRLVSPREDEQRGSQVAYAHPQAYSIAQALIQRKIIVDFRAPDILRIGLTPLYLRFVDMDVAVDNLRDIVENGKYLEPEFQVRKKVT